MRALRHTSLHYLFAMILKILIDWFFMNCIPLILVGYGSVFKTATNGECNRTCFQEMHIQQLQDKPNIAS
jgi:hypothetical protein